MSDNKNLQSARKRKNDEFYTQLSDIEKEMAHYKEYFKGKIILCNCNDATSNFFKYFALNFNYLELKKLIVTECAKENEPAYKIEITSIGDVNGDGSVDFLDVEEMLKSDPSIITKLEGDGKFQSGECVELLKEADIVVTNPPFSLFKEYIAQLLEYNKKFIVIGNQNAIIYKNIFPLIKGDKIWLGYHNVSEFREPNNTIKKFGNIRWFTNIDVKKRHEPIILYKSYNPIEYPTYDNYAAIEVKENKLIPFDYNGIMGVPITFIDKYCPEQFEIIGVTDRANTSGLRTKIYTVEEVSNANDLNSSSVIKENGIYRHIYTRILIRRKQNEN